MRCIVALAVSGLVACGGGSTETTQPAPKLKPAIASVVLTTDKAFLFLQQPAALSDIVAHVSDLNGAEIAKSDLDFTADVPSGWAVRHDSIIPPATEQRAPITVHAVYKVPTLGDLAPVMGLSFDAVAAATNVVTTDAIIDLRLSTWAISDFRCTATPARASVSYWDVNATTQVRIDSLYFSSVRVDSVGTSPSAVYSFGTKPSYSALYYSSNATYYLADGSTFTRPISGGQFVTGQAPDSVVLESGLLVKTQDVPPIYSAQNVTPGAAGWDWASLCNSSWGYRDRMTMHAL